MKILELIEEWRSTICQTSRYKEDLGFIRDMHRLLSYKGYVFPEVRREDAAVLNPSDVSRLLFLVGSYTDVLQNLRSAEEMEEEERAAQSAKLQELIRRGGPHDLQEANKLMKVMAGYDTRNKTDWRAKAAEEVAKVQQKAKLLEENLQNYKQGDQIKDGDVFEVRLVNIHPKLFSDRLQELANALMSAQPKIQKMCEEESDDHEAVAKLLEINDSIHRTIERYRLIKKGDVEGANKIPKGTLGTSGAGVSRGVNNELSLIDLGGPEESELATSSTGGAASAPTGNALEDDLLGLSIGPTFGQGGNIALDTSNGIGSQSSPSPPHQQHLTNTQITSLFNQPQPAVSARPASGTFAGLNVGTPPTSSPAASASAFSPPPVQQQQPPTQRVDPFASLASVSQNSRTTSPFQFQQSTHPPPSAVPQTSNLIGLSSPTAAGQSSRPLAQSSAVLEDEWTFSSALPDTTSELTITNTAITVSWSVSRPPNSPEIIEILSRISNNTAQNISELTFSTAVTRSLQLKLEPQTGRTLRPNQQSGITQTIKLHGVEQGKGTSVRMRWKASYVVDGQAKEEMGEVNGLGIP